MKEFPRLFLPAALVVLAAACTRDIETEVPVAPDGPVRYYLSMDSATKTEISGEGSTRAVSWKAGDKIYYYTQANQEEPKEAVVATDGTGSYIEIDKLGRQDTFINAVYGVLSADYLYSDESSKTEISVASTAACIQDYNTFASAHFCVAHQPDKTVKSLAFHNLTSLIVFDSDTSVDKVVFTGNGGESTLNGGQYGDVLVTFANGGYTVVPNPVADAAVDMDKITVNTKGSDGLFYISVLPTLFQSGFTVKCYDTAGELLCTKLTYKSVDLTTPRILSIGSATDWLASPDPIDPVIPVASVSLNLQAKSVVVGTPFQLTATVEPAQADTTTVTWTSSNPEVAAVSANGYVTTLAVGTAEITATADMKTTVDGLPKSASCIVTVTEPDAPDLSAHGTANCYIAPLAGGTRYRFNASVKGNSTEAITGAAYADVLWECIPEPSYSNVTISSGDVVSAVSLREDGYINFTSVGAGNALIAVRDNAGNILWSWHIWVWPGYNESTASQTYRNNTGVAMDRDLGAISNYSDSDGDYHPFGLLYQWGRKDPFFANDSHKYALGPNVTIVPEPVASDSEKGTIAYTVAHPMQYLLYPANNMSDWLFLNHDDTLWGTEKTMYDPCPPGWVVPGAQFWYKTLNVSSTKYLVIDTRLTPGIDFAGYMADGYEHVFYPAAGGWTGNTDHCFTSLLEGKTYYGYKWTSGVSSGAGVLLAINRQLRQVTTMDKTAKACGFNVRCVKDNTAVVIPDEPVVVTNLTLDQETLSLRVGRSALLTATVTPSNADNTAVEWSSDNESVATVSADGRVTAVAVGTAVITATSAMVSGIMATCNVTVTEAQETDLSADGSANSYIVNAPGEYSFAAVKGNSSTAVTPFRVAILWQSYGTAESVSMYAPVITLPQEPYSGGRINFVVPQAMHDGNAVIAAFDASGTILWSWHVWACKDYEPEKSAQVYEYKTDKASTYVATVMDRNVGAISATPGNVGALGLLYQWGRKDPFLGSSAIHNVSAQTVAASYTESVTWRTVESTASTGTVQYSIANPMTFISTTTGNWMAVNDETLWSSSSKTVYDPCPPGWMMPQGGTEGLWAKAAGTTSSVQHAFSFNSYGANFNGLFGTGTIWYPAAGSRTSDGGVLSTNGSIRVWSAQQYKYQVNQAYALKVDGNSSSSTSTVEVRANLAKGYALSVRCVKEE